MSSKFDIRVFNESGRSVPLNETDFKRTVHTVAVEEDCIINFIEVVYVDEDEIVRINNKHLGRKYITDVITFRYDESEKQNLEGTIFCCAPRIEEQAEELGEQTDREYLRIFIHGLLHLCGYDDQSESQKKIMTQREDYYLDLLH